MTRTFVCLAAALGMFVFSGCGDLPAGGVVAVNSAPPKPAAPAPGDQDLKPTPSSLTPSKLPPIEGPAAGQPPVEQPGNGQPPTVAPPAAPPAGGQQSFDFPNVGQAPSGPTDNGSSGAEPPGGAGRITLSNLSIKRIDPAKISFDVNYEFTEGAPNDRLSYFVCVSAVDPAIPPGEWLVGFCVKPFVGGTLAKKGTFSGEVALRGTTSTYRAIIYANLWGMNKQHVAAQLWQSFVSNEVDSAPVAGVGPAGVPPSNAPAKGADGFLQNPFGETPAKTPAPNGSGNSPSTPAADASLPIALAGGAVSRLSKTTVHFEVGYAFPHGGPDASHWYSVVVHQKPDVDDPTQILPAEKKYRGTSLHPNGTLADDVEQAGRSPVFEISMMEGTSADAKGHLASNVVEVQVHREIQRNDRSDALRPAVPGIGVQGKGYGEGPVATPVAALFTTKEQIALKIQLPSAMQSFYSRFNRNPRSQEEFMKEIIEDNRIELPELPAGNHYIYDPKDGVLKYGPP